MPKNIYVDLKTNAYTVRVGSGILKSCFADLLNGHKEDVYIVTNETINKHYPGYIEKSLPARLKCRRKILPDGEKFKNLDTLSQVYDFLIENGANRKSLLIAFGGGVVGDIGGFAAGTYMRGIPYIQVPTTLLAQVDSSIGGKTGVNHEKGKNSIGCFKQPIETIIDVTFLNSLPKREFRAGYAELIKHGLIQDAFLFEYLSKKSWEKLRGDRDILIESVFRSCQVKGRVVQQDEKESNLRAILNFGHTLGHFIETFTEYKKYLHGEAVIGGMDFAAWWSMKKKLLSNDDRKRIHEHLKQLNVAIEIGKVEKDAFIEIVGHDKKAESEGVTFVGLDGIGRARLFPGQNLEELWKLFSEYLAEPDPLIQQAA